MTQPKRPGRMTCIPPRIQAAFFDALLHGYPGVIEVDREETPGAEWNADVFVYLGGGGHRISGFGKTASAAIAALEKALSELAKAGKDATP